MNQLNKKLLFLVLLLKVSFISAQNVNPETLDSLYVDALKNRYNLLLSSGYKYFESNEQTERIKTKFNSSVYKFPNQNELFEIAYKKNKKLNLYRLNHKIISNDTIDINFGDLYLTVKKGIFFKNGLHFKKMNYSISCGGTNGYIPDFRYVYNKSEKKWINISEKYKLITK